MTMNALRKIYVFSLLTFLSTGPVLAQQGRDAAKVVLEKMKDAYARASYLSFHVNYLYANESQAGSPTDSIPGDFQMDKNRVRFTIDGTETLVTPLHSIRVRSEDRIIFLGRSSQDGPQVDPASMVDTLLRQINGSDVQLRDEGAQAVIGIQFPPGLQYKRVEIVVDKQTNYLREITYFLKTEALVGQELVKGAGHDGPYESDGRVRIVFSRYQQRAFGDAVFDEARLVSRVGGTYQPADAYKGYQLILTSSKL